MIANKCRVGHVPARPTRSIGPVEVAVLSRQDAIRDINDYVRSREPHTFAFANAHTINLARTSAPFRVALSAATILNDGVGLDIASKFLHHTTFSENLNGTDFTRDVLHALPQATRVFLLGSRPQVVEEARRKLEADFPQLDFVGAVSGYFAPEDEKTVANEIAASSAQLVLVGMGQPRQELWAARHLRRTGSVLLCVGAFLDFTAGKFPRAPSWVRAARLEWLYRLMQEPHRLWRRYLVGNLTFLIYVARLKLAAGK